MACLVLAFSGALRSEAPFMDAEQKQFLGLRTLPGRLTMEQTAWLLGFQPHEIPILVAAKLLRSLGHPPANGAKFFSSSVIQERMTDTAFLDRASEAVVRFWKSKNCTRRNGTKSHQNGGNGKPRKPLDLDLERLSDATLGKPQRQPSAA